MSGIFLPRPDVTEKARRQRTIGAHLLVGDGQKQVVGVAVVFRQVERGPSRHVEQRGVLAQGGYIRGKPLIQLDLRKTLAMADVQLSQRSPAWAEVELALLPGAMLVVEYDLVFSAPCGNSGTINL